MYVTFAACEVPHEVAHVHKTYLLAEHVVDVLRKSGLLPFFKSNDVAIALLVFRIPGPWQYRLLTGFVNVIHFAVGNFVFVLAFGVHRGTVFKIDDLCGEIRSEQKWATAILLTFQISDE